MKELFNIEEIDFKKGNGLVPAVVQDVDSGQVLMLAYMNKESLEKTCEIGKATFYSRSRNCLWTKGETSGNFLNVRSISTDCDKDTLLLLVKPTGPACHLGNTSCFNDAQHDGLFLWELEKILDGRKNADPKVSYTARLYQEGTKRIAQKVGEEGVETALAATVHDREELINEASDLVYHLLVLLQAEGLQFNDIVGNLKKRHAK